MPSMKKDMVIFLTEQKLRLRDRGTDVCLVNSKTMAPIHGASADSSFL